MFTAIGKLRHCAALIVLTVLIGACEGDKDSSRIIPIFDNMPPLVWSSNCIWPKYQTVSTWRRSLYGPEFDYRSFGVPLDSAVTRLQTFIVGVEPSWVMSDSCDENYDEYHFQYGANEVRALSDHPDDKEVFPWLKNLYREPYTQICSRVQVDSFLDTKKDSYTLLLGARANVKYYGCEGAEYPEIFSSPARYLRFEFDRPSRLIYKEYWPKYAKSIVLIDTLIQDEIANKAMAIVEKYRGGVFFSDLAVLGCAMPFDGEWAPGTGKRNTIRLNAIHCVEYQYDQSRRHYVDSRDTSIFSYAGIGIFASNEKITVALGDVDTYRYDECQEHLGGGMRLILPGIEALIKPILLASIRKFENDTSQIAKEATAFWKSDEFWFYKGAGLAANQP